MKSIDILYNELNSAKQQGLIQGHEDIKNRDIILVELKEDTTDKTCRKLMKYIQDTYKNVIHVTLNPSTRSIFIRYIT